jgi:hypothetical protein
MASPIVHVSLRFHSLQGHYLDTYKEKGKKDGKQKTDQKKDQYQRNHKKRPCMLADTIN